MMGRVANGRALVLRGKLVSVMAQGEGATAAKCEREAEVGSSRVG
jgi:hypothetical protein